MPRRYLSSSSPSALSKYKWLMVIAVAPLFYQIHMHASLSSKIDALHLTDYSFLRENAEAPVVIRMLDNFGMLPDKQAKSSGGDDVPRQLYNESSDTGFNTIARKRYVGGLVLPNVLLVGAQKAGTTSIEVLLRDNGVCHAQSFPDEPIFFSKEVHFFDRKDRYDKGIEFYSRRFQVCSRRKKQFILDATPNYLNRAERVYKTYTDKKAKESAIKNLKIICVLREPVSRELSWYNHKLSRVLSDEGSDVAHWAQTVVHENENSTIKTFDEYSDELARKIKEKSSDKDKGFHTMGLYVDHLKEWEKWFDRRNILILSYDELLQEPAMTIQRIEKFLGTKLIGSLRRANTNENSRKVKEVSSYAKAVLGPLYKDKNEELYRFIRDHPGPPMEQSPFPRFQNVDAS